MKSLNWQAKHCVSISKYMRNKREKVTGYINSCYLDSNAYPWKRNSRNQCYLTFLWSAEATEDSHFHKPFCLVIYRCLSDFKRSTIIVLFVPLRNQHNVHWFPSFSTFQLKTKQWKKYRKHYLGQLFVKTTQNVQYKQNPSFIFLLLLFLTRPSRII